MELIRSLQHLVKRGSQIALLVILVIGTAFIYIPPDNKHSYQSSLIKRDQIRSIPGARIILAGGSSLALGIDSEKMEAALGMPVINNGLHAALGVAPLEEIRPLIHPGDIIIISLEFYNFLDDVSFYGNPQYTSDWVEIAPERIWYLKDPLAQMPVVYTLILQHKIKRELNYYLYGGTLDPIRNGFTADKFNSYGDFIGHLGVEYPLPIANTPYPVRYLDAAYIYLENFNQDAIAKGAVVFFEEQPHRQSNCDTTGVGLLREFYLELKKIPAFLLSHRGRNSAIPMIISITHHII